MLRDSLRADLLEAQQERFQDLESKFLEKAWPWAGCHGCNKGAKSARDVSDLNLPET